MSRLGLVTPVCALLLCGAACKTPSSRLDLEKIEQNEAERDDKTGDAATKLDPLPVERPADLLPADVAVMAEASDPSQVLLLFAGLGQIPEFASVRGEVAGTLGGDLLLADEWSKLGLDSHRPAGIALLDVRGEAFCGWVSVSDSNLFDQTVRKAAKAIGLDRDLTVGEMAGSRVYRFNDEFSIVVRAGIAMFVVVGDARDAARDYPAMAATIDPRDSLGRSEAFDWARGQARGGDDGLIFMVPGKLFDTIARESSGDDYGTKYAEEQLANARRNGTDANGIRELEERVAQEREWQLEREREQKAGTDLARELLGPMHALVFTGDVGVTRIDAQARLLMPNGGLLRDIFVPTQTPSPLTTALDEPALMVLDGQVDVQKFLRLIDMLAKADGESLDKIDQDVRSETGISVLTSVVPLFDGRGGFALTRSRPANPKKFDDLPKTLGLAIQFGLKDADGLRKVLDDLARNPDAAKLFKSRKTGWEIQVPEWRNVFIDVAGDRLIISTDKGLAGRVRDAKPGKQKLPADHLLFGSSPTPALSFYQDWSWITLVNPPYVYIQTQENMLYELDSHATLSREQAAKVPQSKADTQLRKELQKVLGELEGIERRRGEQQFNAMQTAMNELGEASIQLDVVPDGLSAHGVWQLRGQRSIIEIGASMFMMTSMGGSPDDMERDRLNNRAWELANEIRTQRMIDLDTFAAKQSKPATP
jgi:hypothetical protein